ncbi:MAG: lysophospholipid acyltransferase family protein [Pseudomonadota bacterium]
MARRWVLSLLFSIQIYAAMLVLALVFFPAALVSRKGAKRACHTWCAWVLWSARTMLGLRTEIRGTPPEGAVLVAAKHQSFLDIILIFHSLPSARFIMKRILLFSPIFGQYAWRIGCIPVNRGKRGAAIAKMVRDATREMALPGQLIIYPQGTRVAPGAHKPYKIGTGVLYETMEQTCVPVATNAGVFWPRRGIIRQPGLAVVEFLDPVPPGQPKEDFLAQIEPLIETASDRLMEEAGFRKEKTA